MSVPLSSAIYAGRIRHRRHAPHPHAFWYRIYLVYLDLSELDAAFKGHRFWSNGRRNLGEFRRSDYLGDPDTPLDEAVRQRVASVTGKRPEGPIRMLAHLRTFGHCFNPVAFYYCFHPDGERLDCIVAEITNTPWKERHCYVLSTEQAGIHGSAYGWDFPKAFHVSPFLPMARDYRWRFQVPGMALRVHMDVLDAGTSQFDATLVLERREWNDTNLTRCLLHYPFMSLRVVLAIHWQAFLIWCRRNPVYDHPSTSSPNPGAGSKR